MVTHSDNWMSAELEALQTQSRFRSLQMARPLGGGWIDRAGRRVLDLSSNDYLGLAGELTVELEPGDASATASRLVVGNHPAYTELENTVANLKETEAALVFGCGFLANSSIIPAIVGREDTVFCDRLNHASIVDGIILSRARLKRYRHNDMSHLATLLAEDSPGRKLIVSDSIFSMDGDIAPLAALVELKNRYGAMLMVDEAHSGGVYGDRGQGLVHELGLTQEVDIQMGTFSKAYGCYGAYVAGTRILVNYLINRARGLIFSTGLPPIVVRLAIMAVERAAKEAWRREHLHANASRFRERLVELGFDTGSSVSQIVPVIVGEEAAALAFSEKLLLAGVCAVAIRPPTVPVGTARLRFSLSAAHRWEDLAAALDVIARIGRDLDLLPSLESSP